MRLNEDGIPVADKAEAAEAVAAFVHALERADVSRRVKDVLVYGSRARGDWRTDSDIDVAVIIQGAFAPGEDLTILHALSDQTFDACARHGFLISPIPIAEDELVAANSRGNLEFYRNVRTDGVGWQDYCEG